MAANAYAQGHFYTSAAQPSITRTGSTQDAPASTAAPSYYRQDQREEPTYAASSYQQQTPSYGHEQSLPGRNATGYDNVWYNGAGAASTTPSQGPAHIAGGVAEDGRTTKDRASQKAYDTTALGSLAYASGLDYAGTDASNRISQQVSRPTGFNSYSAVSQPNRMHQTVNQPPYRSPVQNLMPTNATTAPEFEQARSHSSNSNVSHPGASYVQHHSPHLVANIASLSNNKLPHPRQSYYGASTMGNTSSTQAVPYQPDYTPQDESQARPTPQRPPQRKTRTRSVATESQPSTTHGRQGQAVSALPTLDHQAQINQQRAQINQQALQYAYDSRNSGRRPSQTVGRPGLDGADSPTVSAGWNSPNAGAAAQVAPEMNRVASPAQAIQHYAGSRINDGPTGTSTYYEQSNHHQRTQSAASNRSAGKIAEPAIPQPVEQTPTTVDPSQVYNSYHEYRAEIAAADAAARERELARTMSPNIDPGLGQLHPSTAAVDTAAAAISYGQGAAAQQSQAANVVGVQAPAAVPTPPQSTSAPPTEDMEEQMRLMVEKMREYQAKDPSLFSQVWEQVKKKSTQADGRPQSRQASLPVATQSNVVPVDAPESQPSQQIGGSGQLTSPTQTPAQVPPETQVKGSRAKSKAPAKPRAPRKSRGKPKADVRDGPSRVTPDKAVQGVRIHNEAQSTPSAPVPSQSREAHRPSVQSSTTSSVTPAKGPPVSASSVTPVNPMAHNNQSPRTPTDWPDRNNLAWLAANILLALPGNAGKPITPESISSLLAHGPSYIELCEGLEGMGIIVERRSFARDLLAAAPNTKAPVPPKRADSNGPLPVASAGGGLNGSASSSVPQRPSQVPGVASTGVHVHQDITGQAAGNTGASHAAAVNGPGSAGEQGHVPPRQAVTRPESNATPRQQGGPLAPSHPNQGHVIGANANPTPPNSDNVKPMSKAEAAKKTFAQILDSSQAHPGYADLRALALHTPQPPLTAFTAFTALNGSYRAPSALLATPPSSLPVPLEQQQTPGSAPLSMSKSQSLQLEDLAKPIDKRDAARVSEYNPNTIARDLLISTGRHPTQRALNEHLLPLKLNFKTITNASDLSTFDWERVDPGGPVVGSASVERKDGNEADDERDEVAGNAGAHLHLTSTSTSTLKRRRARPSRDKSSAKEISTAVSDPPSETRAHPPGFGDAARPGGGAPASTNRNLLAGVMINPPTRSNGHSSGDRQGMPRRGRGGRGGGGGGGDRRSGRSGHDAPPREVTFDCRWRDCGVKLHNLDTLRKHVVNVHCRELASRGYPCAWSGCGTMTAVPNHRPGQQATVRHDLDFDTKEQWKDHVVTAHLTNIAWRYGDGPSVGGRSGDDSESSYLSDSLNRPIGPMAPDLVPDENGVMPPARAPPQRAAGVVQEVTQRRMKELSRVLGRQGSVLAVRKDKKRGVKFWVKNKFSGEFDKGSSSSGSSGEEGRERKKIKSRQRSLDRDGQDRNTVKPGQEGKKTTAREAKAGQKRSHEDDESGGMMRLQMRLKEISSRLGAQR